MLSFYSLSVLGTTQAVQIRYLNLQAQPRHTSLFPLALWIAYFVLKYPFKWWDETSSEIQVTAVVFKTGFLECIKMA